MKTNHDKKQSYLKIGFQVGCSIFLASLIVTKLIFKSLNVNAFAFLLLVIIILSSFFIAIVSFLRSVKTRSLKIASRIENRKYPLLSIEEARTIAERLLADPLKFKCRKPASGTAPSIAGLPSTLIKFFSEYSQVNVVYGDGRLDSSSIRQSLFDDRYLKVGSDAGCELAIRYDEDPIYEVDGDVSSAYPSYPSVYHWIISMDDQIYSK